MNSDHSAISKKIRIYKELSYLGGFFEEVLEKELNQALPGGLSVDDLKKIPGQDMYDIIDYVHEQTIKAGIYLNGYDVISEDIDGIKKWFVGEALRIRNNTVFKRIVSILAHNNVLVSMVEAEIIYYLLGMDGKGERGAKEVSRLRRFRSGSVYARYLAECINENEETLDIVIDNLDCK